MLNNKFTFRTSCDVVKRSCRRMFASSSGRAVKFRGVKLSRRQVLTSPSCRFAELLRRRVVASPICRVAELPRRQVVCRRFAGK